MKYCEIFRDAIESLADGELPADQEAALRAHLASCDGCRAYYESLCAINESLGETADIDLPPRFHEELMGCIRSEKPRQRHLPRRALVTVAACALLCVGIGASLHLSGRQSAADSAASYSVMETDGAAVGGDQMEKAVMTTGDGVDAAQWLSNNGYFPDTGHCYTLSPDVYDALLSYLGTTAEEADITVLSRTEDEVLLLLPEE